jgi:hypothetical protein
MGLSAPKQVTWIIALILGIVGIVGQVAIPALSGYGIWILAVGWVLLILATLFEGL